MAKSHNNKQRHNGKKSSKRTSRKPAKSPFLLFLRRLFGYNGGIGVAVRKRKKADSRERICKSSVKAKQTVGKTAVRSAKQKQVIAQSAKREQKIAQSAKTKQLIAQSAKTEQAAVHNAKREQTLDKTATVRSAKPHVKHSVLPAFSCITLIIAASAMVTSVVVRWDRLLPSSEISSAFISKTEANDTCAVAAKISEMAYTSVESITVMSIANRLSETVSEYSMPELTFLSKGMESQSVVDLQGRLMELGYFYADETSDSYGVLTEAAVSAFQRQHGLPVSGVADNATLELMFSFDARKYCLNKGDEGADVSLLQTKLAELGYINTVTGFYGDATAHAVSSFQHKNGIVSQNTVVGVADFMTIEAINSETAVPYTDYGAEQATYRRINKFIAIARGLKGSRYVGGAEGPDRFDCSGFVFYCLRTCGVNVARQNAAGYARTSAWSKTTSMNNIQRGDLLFFYDDAFTKIGHVAIYSGGGYMIDASDGLGRVVERTCRTSYWRIHFSHALRPW